MCGTVHEDCSGLNLLDSLCYSRFTSSYSTAAIVPCPEGSKYPVHIAIWRLESWKLVQSREVFCARRLQSTHLNAMHICCLPAESVVSSAITWPDEVWRSVHYSLESGFHSDSRDSQKRRRSPLRKTFRLRYSAEHNSGRFLKLPSFWYVPAKQDPADLSTSRWSSPLQEPRDSCSGHVFAVQLAERPLFDSSCDGSISPHFHNALQTPRDVCSVYH